MEYDIWKLKGKNKILLWKLMAETHDGLTLKIITN
jgi:hypothetical protein